MKNIYASFKYGDFLRTVRNKNSLAFPIKALGDKEYNVVIQEYQLDPVTGAIVHVDLRVAIPNTISNYLVPVKTHGIPKGIKNKGVLQ